MTAAMVLIFLVCWTPYFIATVIHFTKIAHLPSVINTVTFYYYTSSLPPPVPSFVSDSLPAGYFQQR